MAIVMLLYKPVVTAVRKAGLCPSKSGKMLAICFILAVVPLMPAYPFPGTEGAI